MDGDLGCPFGWDGRCFFWMGVSPVKMKLCQVLRYGRSKPLPYRNTEVALKMTKGAGSRAIGESLSC